ncbi:MAG TPA: SDR family oxidoreductase [Candidatus Eisenbacteria bacterium]|nr:SDR family oxidoreductase [Candidatus Eisenbacteria bacterium]
MPVAVITGASRGLGLALAGELSRRGWHLVLDARHETDLLSVASGLRGTGRVAALPGDVTDPAHRDRLAEAASRLGGADLLVNNASTLGASPLPRVADLSPDTLAAVYATNVLAPLALVQLLLPQLTPRHGRIVNVTSDAGVEAYEGWGGYGSSKAALDQLTAVLGVEQPGLRVYAFDPGDMRTRMQQDAFPGEYISDRPEPETVVPHMLALVEGDLPSCRYRATDLPTGRREGAPA